MTPVNEGGEAHEGPRDRDSSASCATRRAAVPASARGTPERGLIVGGGIAGLSLAAALRQNGHAPELVERAPAFGAAGAGIALSPNALAMLRRLRIEESVRDLATELSNAAVTDAEGRTLMHTDLGPLTAHFGPTLAIHRSDLHQVLLSACEGLTLRAGTTLASLRAHDEVVAVEFSDGQQREFDLVVGADGLHSQVRRLVFGDRPAIYAGYTCWRLVCRAPIELVGLREMWGRGLRFGLVPLTQNRVYCFAVANAPAATPDPRSGRLERFRKRFADFGGAVPAVLAELRSPDELIHNDLADLDEPVWHRGRVVLVGDAAHAVTPNMGQGAAMALESSVLLAEALSASEPLAERLANWHARRHDRVRFVRKQSRRIGRVGHWENRAACTLRNGSLRLTPNRFAAAALVRLASTPV